MINYFSKEETECKCGCGQDITDGFRHFLNLVREDVGEPLYLSSGCRCEAYDKDIGGKGVHPTGEAGDIKCSGKLAYKVQKSCFKYGATGIGVSQKGDHGKRFIHADRTVGPLRPWAWSY